MKIVIEIEETELNPIETALALRTISDAIADSDIANVRGMAGARYIVGLGDITYVVGE